MQSPFGLIQLSAIPILLGIAIPPKIAISQTQWQVTEPGGIACYENVPVDGENDGIDAIAQTFLEGEAIVLADEGIDEGEAGWLPVRLDGEDRCWIDGTLRGIESIETPLEITAFPITNERGNYPSNSPNHPRWEVTNRGLSGLNCYQTHPPNQGSHIVVSRFFNGHILTVADSEIETDVFAESNNRTWMAVNDPWSGQTCWVRAHEDFIKPIE